MRKLLLTLTVLGLISAFALAFVYQWTMPKILHHQEVGKKDAILTVLPGSDQYQEVRKGELTFYEGNKNGEVAMVASGGGFQGQIEVMIGFNPAAGKVYSIKVLNHQETPGLGAYIAGGKFERNFVDKPFGEYKVVKRPVKNAHEVEAIAGATISSEKVAEIVEKAIKEIREVYGGEI